MKRAFFIVGFFVLLAVVLYIAVPNRTLEPIKVGVLHSQTGTMAISEQSVIDATLLAVEELNQSGGVLGLPVEPVLADGGSDPVRFRTEAQRLIDVEKVSVIFGCWTSASRKEVKPVVEKAEHLLVYPLQYEGVEGSPAIVYTGAVPNQQVKPAVKWAMDNLGKRFYLVGSDYIFPHIVNRFIKDLAEFLGGEVIAERYRRMGNIDFVNIAKEIATMRPAVVFNTLNGDSNIAFFDALVKQGISGGDIPVFSFSITESELQAMSQVLPPRTMIGHYVSWSYFASLPGEENESFLKKFHKRYGSHRRVSDPMVSAFVGVKLWAQAVAEAASPDPQKVRRAFSRQSLNGPGGIVYIDDKSHHAWKPDRIGRIDNNDRIEMVWDSYKPIRPEPYPPYVEREYWEKLENMFYQQWDNHWSAASEAMP